MNNEELEKEIKEIKGWVEEIRRIMGLDCHMSNYNPRFLVTVGINKDGKCILG
jgi:hypothetical protein